MYFAPKPDPTKTGADTVLTGRVDSQPLPQQPIQQPQQKLPAKYSGLADAPDSYVTIDGPLYRAIINRRGGLLSRFELKNYQRWYGTEEKPEYVQLISDSTGFPGELGIGFTTRDGNEISTRDLRFEIDAPEVVTLSGSDSVVITARLNLPARTDTSAADTTSPSYQGAIVKRYVFRGDEYGVGFQVMMEEMANEISGGAYTIDWQRGLMYQENNSVDESSTAKAIVSTADDLVEIDAADPDEPVSQKVTGTLNWVGTKTKYFGMALIPDQPLTGGEVTIQGNARPVGADGRIETYSIALKVPYASATDTRSFTLFAGPLDYDVAKTYGVQTMLDFGMSLIRPISEFFLLPIFRTIHHVIANYGVVIIVFSILIRLLLWPLSVPQIKSSQKMKLLQPKITEIREKYPEDQQRQQMETMNLYREYGINPVSGCLPLLLQMPILYALWATLNSAIDLRKADFALWITDLSVPDVVLTLPLSLPLLGNTLSGLALIMGATLFIQQKMMITDPKQKAMIYVMPVLLTVMFNHLPSGLNLYYLMFNLLSIGQQIYMTNFAKTTVTLDELKSKASKKKKGWFAQKMEEAQKMAQMQQQMTGTDKNPRTKVDGRTPVEPKKNRKS
jgi:YidC/Oxa1 family membrane protein insertase